MIGVHNIGEAGESCLTKAALMMGKSGHLCHSITGLPQQLQHQLRLLVCLGHDGSTGLLEDGHTGQVGCFFGYVGVHDAAAGCTLVFVDIGEVADHGLETVH